MKRFVTAVIGSFEAEWLRKPNEEDILEIEKRYSRLGFPGCIGAVDCASWEWANCPLAWQGLHKGKEKKPNCRMEVGCDDILRILHLNFGIPGSFNDRTILEHSPLFNAGRSGRWRPVCPYTSVSVLALDWFYYLADGIYPDLRIFLKPLAAPRTANEKMFSKYQSAARKALEPVFGVMFARFHILCIPARLWEKDELISVVKACVIMHNMVCATRKQQYSGTTNILSEADAEIVQALPLKSLQIISGESTCAQDCEWRQHVDATESSVECARLRQAIMDYIWNMNGDFE